MSRFVASSNHLFLYGTGDGAIVVLDMGSDLNNPSSTPDNWRAAAIIIPCTTALVTVNHSAKPIARYKELEVFGTVIGGTALEKLRADLFDSQFLVNREGYQVMYYSTSDDGGGLKAKAMVIGKCSFYKLNNMFGWRRYGVKPPAITTVWNRYDRSSGEAVVDLVELGEKVRVLEVKVGEQSKELVGCRARLVEKEIVEHYKRIVAGSREVMKEKESAAAEKDGEIRRLKLRLEGGGNYGIGIGIGGDDELKEIRDRLVAKEKQMDDFKAAVNDFFRT